MNMAKEFYPAPAGENGSISSRLSSPAARPPWSQPTVTAQKQPAATSTSNTGNYY